MRDARDDALMWAAGVFDSGGVAGMYKVTTRARDARYKDGIYLSMRLWIRIEPALTRKFLNAVNLGHIRPVRESGRISIHGRDQIGLLRAIEPFSQKPEEVAILLGVKELQAKTLQDRRQAESLMNLWRQYKKARKWSGLKARKMRVDLARELQ